MNLNKIIEEWVGEKLGKDTAGKSPDEIYGYNCSIEDLKSRIPQLTERIVGEIFNSKKGDMVRLPKTDGTEQVWQCIEILKSLTE